MSRLEKKCFIAATGTHLFLFLLVIFGSAFFVSHDKLSDVHPLRVVATTAIDNALSGGGGNPNIAHSDAQQKGETLVPQPVQPQPAPVRPVQPPPKPEVKRTEPKPVVKKDKPEPPKPPKDVVKDNPKTKPDNTKISKDPPIELKPVTRTNEDKVREAQEADARAQARADALARKRAADVVGKAVEGLRAGFKQGTKVEIDGLGGQAYADYADIVKSVYEDAWLVTDQLTDDDATANVVVTIARSGRVISARIERHSGDSLLDKSVQRALDTVRFVHAFPAESHDEQRSFTINFNLKSKRLRG